MRACQQPGPHGRRRIGGPEPPHLVLLEDAVPGEQLVGAFAGEDDLHPLVVHQPREEEQRGRCGAQQRRLAVPHDRTQGVADLGVAADDLVVLRAEQVGHAALADAFVEPRVGEADRERLERAAVDVADERRDHRGVETTTEVRAHGDVGAQPESHRLLEQAAELVGGVVDGAARRGGVLAEVRLPVPRLVQVQIVVDAHAGTGLHALYTGEHRPRRRGRPTGEGLDHRRGVDHRGRRAARQQRLDLGAEHHSRRCGRQVHRQDPEAVAHQPERIDAPVPQCERELPVEELPGPLPVLLVEVDDHLGVALGGEAVALALQLPPQLDEVEDLPVEAEPHRAVLVGDRLEAVGDVDDAQPAVRETDAVVAVQAVAVGSAMAEHRDHGRQGLEGNRCTPRRREKTSDAAHGRQR